MLFLRKALLSVGLLLATGAVAIGNSDLFLKTRRPVFVDPNKHFPLCEEDDSTPYCRRAGAVKVQIMVPHDETSLSAKEFSDIVLALGTVERIPAEIIDSYLPPSVWNGRNIPYLYSFELKVPVGSEAKFCAAYLSVESLKDAALKVESYKDTAFNHQRLDCRQALGGHPTGSAGVKNLQLTTPN
jgi:hypothetical protein